MQKFNNKMVIELKDKDGKVIDKRTYGNIVTNGYINLVKSFFNPSVLQMGPNIRTCFATYPPRVAFGGVQMFDNYISETADTLNVSDVLTRGTCHAGGEYSGNDTTRGTLLTSECEYTNDYIKLKWEWGTKRGNGTHKSVALMPVNGGNTGITNDILNTTDSTLRDSDISTYNPFFSLPSSRVYSDSAPNISKGGTFMGASPDLRHIYVMREFDGNANPIKCFIDEYELIDFSNIRMNDYLFACQQGVGVQRVRTITVPDIPKDDGSGYNPTNWSFNPFRKEVYFFNTSIGILRTYSLETNEIIHTITLDKTTQNIGVKCNVARIGDWLYVESGNNTYDKRGIYRFSYTNGSFIDEYRIPYHSAMPAYFELIMYQFSNTEIFLNCGGFAYIFDGEKFNGLYKTDGYTILHKTDYYPLLYRNDFDFAIDNRCLMTVHNFDAPIVKEEGMTMTLTYLIQHAEATNQ